MRLCVVFSIPPPNGLTFSRKVRPWHRSHAQYSRECLATQSHRPAQTLAQPRGYFLFFFPQYCSQSLLTFFACQSDMFSTCSRYMRMQHIWSILQAGSNAAVIALFIKKGWLPCLLLRSNLPRLFALFFKLKNMFLSTIFNYSALYSPACQGDVHSP